jgi:hypothetical protein
MSSLSIRECAPGPATADLHFCLLGPPSLAWRDEPLALPRRQAWALLYHLAAVPQLIAREQLCLLLWPDTPETTARCNLNLLWHPPLLVLLFILSNDSQFIWRRLQPQPRLDCAVLCHLDRDPGQLPSGAAAQPADILLTSNLPPAILPTTSDAVAPVVPVGVGGLCSSQG